MVLRHLRLPTVVLLGGLVVLGNGLAPAAEAQRITVVVYGADAFSRRPAEWVEYSAGLRLSREPGVEWIPAESLVVVEGGDPEVEAFARAVQHTRAGMEAYDNLELDQALAELSAAVEGFERAIGPLCTDRERGYATALTYLGAARILRGELQEGQDLFRRLLVFDRRSQLDKKVFPPGMVSMFASAREEVLSAPTGSLSIFSSPGHAKVFVDGVFRGVTPATVGALAVGRHLVHVRKGGYKGWSRLAVVEPTEERALQCRLPELPGGERLQRAIEQAAGALDEGDRLASELQELALDFRLQRVLVGRVEQGGAGAGVRLSLFDVASGASIRSHSVDLPEDPAALARSIDGMCSFLLTGRADVLQSAAAVEVEAGPLRLADEERFEEADEPIWRRWTFWAAVGGGVAVAAAVAIVLALVLPGESGEPDGQILLVFDNP